MIGGAFLRWSNSAISIRTFSGAKAAQRNAKLGRDWEIGGVNTTVAQIQAQLADAKWDLEQTTVRAPADGIVTLMAPTVGDRALQALLTQPPARLTHQSGDP
jgi:multidrug resistance efflux pump